MTNSLRSAWRGLFVGALLSTQLACGATTSSSEPAFTPVVSASARTGRAITRGLAGVMDLPAIPLRLRYNSAPCDCPSWELEMYGSWHRVALVSARDASPSVQPFLSYEEHAEGSVFRAQIAPNVEQLSVEDAWSYPLFEVIDVSDE